MSTSTGERATHVGGFPRGAGFLAAPRSIAARGLAVARWLQMCGVDRAGALGLGKQILLVNTLTLVASALYVFGLISDLLMPPSWMLHLDVFALLSHLFLPLLNRVGRFLTARCLFLLLTNGVTCLAAAAEGPDSGLQYLLLPLAPVPLVLFTLDRRRELCALFACVLMSVLGFFALEATHYRDLIPEAMRLPTSRVIFLDSVASAFVFSLATTFYFLVGERRAERELREQQGQVLASAKLNALGEMAGGVAHEINNPLGILTLLSARLTLLAKQERLDPALARKLSADIETNLGRVATVVRNLRAFARDGSRDPVARIALADVIKDAVGFCKARCTSAGIVLRVMSVSRTLAIDCRSIEVTQILLNLLHNAREAAEKQEHGVRWIDVAVVEVPPVIEVRVTNSGPVIEHHHRSRIFEPFFTTKPIGRGTGMGLSVSLGLAEAHGGTLLLDEASLHTCFVLRLPRARDSAPPHQSLQG
ncbi:MAG: ATP-binding protein [Myxococcales bacterium]